MQEQKRDR